MDAPPATLHQVLYEYSQIYLFVCCSPVLERPRSTSTSVSGYATRWADMTRVMIGGGRVSLTGRTAVLMLRQRLGTK